MPTDPKQIKVISQLGIGLDGDQTCGYHTFKNSLLTLMFQKKIITEQEYQLMLDSKELFVAIYEKIKTYQYDSQGRPHIDQHTKQPMVDFNTPLFIQKLNDIRQGKIVIDCPTFPTFQDKLNSLKEAITANAENSDLTVVNCNDQEEYGLYDGRFPAAMAARFARQPGPSKHVIACGRTNQGHWITFVVNKDAEGKLTWQYMDSMRNQTLNQSFTTVIERVLTKTQLELKNYLIKAYGVGSEPVGDYDLYFDNAGNPRRPSCPNIKAHFVDKTKPCNFLRLEEDPRLIGMPALKERIDKVRIDQQARETAIAPPPGAAPPALPELTSCFLMHNAKLYYASFEANTIVELKQFGSNVAAAQYLFTQDFTIATEDERDLLGSVVIPNAKEKFVTATKDCLLVLPEKNPTAMTIEDFKKHLDTDAIFLYETDLYYADRAAKSFTKIQLPLNSDPAFQRVKHLFTANYTIAGPEDQRELEKLLPAWKDKVNTSIGLLKVLKNNSVPIPPSEFDTNTVKGQGQRDSLFNKLKHTISSKVARYGNELYYINDTITKIKKEGKEEQYDRLLNKFTTSSHVKADEETIKLIEELTGVSHKVNLQDEIYNIEQRFNFMKIAGWFQAQYKGAEEHERILKLYNISRFILSNVDTDHPTDKEATCRLTPIAEALKAALNLPIQTVFAAAPVSPRPIPAPIEPVQLPEPGANLEPSPLPIPASPIGAKPAPHPLDPDPIDPLNDPDLAALGLKQQLAALNQADTEEPKPRQGFINVLVQAITRILEAIRDAFWYVASHISVGA